MKKTKRQKINENKIFKIVKNRVLGEKKLKKKKKQNNFVEKKNVFVFFPKKHFWRGRIIHPPCENKQFFVHDGGGELFGKFGYSSLYPL